MITDARPAPGLAITLSVLGGTVVGVCAIAAVVSEVGRRPEALYKFGPGVIIGALLIGGARLLAQRKRSGRLMLALTCGVVIIGLCIIIPLTTDDRDGMASVAALMGIGLATPPALTLIFLAHPSTGKHVRGE